LTALISILLAFDQTQAYTARP